MGWSTTHVWSSGDVVYAADLNNLGDNIDFLYGGHGTSFPGSPQDQQSYTYDADPTNGVSWNFYYNATEASWIFLGGAPLYSLVATDESTTSATYAALTTAGPSVVLPFGGTFDVEIGARMYPSATADFIGYMSYDIGGTGAVDGDAVTHEVNLSGAGSIGSNVSWFQRKTALSATTLTAKYKVSSATAFHFVNRWMKVTPVHT